METRREWFARYYPHIAGWWNDFHPVQTEEI